MILEEIWSVQIIINNGLLPYNMLEGCYCVFLVKAEFVPQKVYCHVGSNGPHLVQMCLCFWVCTSRWVNHSLSQSQKELNIHLLQDCFVGFHDICAGVSLCEDFTVCLQQFLCAHLKPKFHLTLLCLSLLPLAFVIYHLTLQCLSSISPPRYKLIHFTFLWTGAKLSLMMLWRQRGDRAVTYTSHINAC